MTTNQLDLKIMSRLKVLREKEILTDIILRTDDEQFKAHKIILSCLSEYFCALFTEPMLESRSNEVYLSMLTSRGLKIILDYIYTLKMDINADNVAEVLHTASYLQIDSAISSCDLFLRENINNDNILDIINIAETYSLTDLKYHAYVHLAANLSKIMQNKEIYKLSAQQIEYFLANDLITDCSENKVLEFVLGWFLRSTTKNTRQKLDKAEEILSNIIFSNITNRQLYRIITEYFPNETIRKDHIIYKTILEKKFLSDSIAQKYSLAYPENKRGMKKAFVLVGGICNLGITNNILYRFVDENKWNDLTAIPHVDQCNYGTAVYKNELYIFGGCYNESVEEEILHPYAFSFDPRKDVWKTLQPMKQPRCRFTLTLLEDSLYAIGGCVDAGTFPFSPLDAGCNLCDKYIISKNSWSHIASLPKGICQHAACTLHVGKSEHIFVSGGLHNGIASNELYEYHPTRDIWCTKAKLLVPRVDHYMFNYQNNLYICGGWNYGPDNMRRYLLHTIDLYDSNKNIWTTIAHKTKATYHCAIVINGSKIYFIGGFNYDSEFHRIYENVEYYDIDTNQWTVVDEKPPEIWEHDCVMMYVPKNKYLHNSFS